MSEGRDRQILEAAADLFYERGYAATSLAAIGERVGISGPAIYGHFANKEEILRTLVLESAERLEAGHGDPVDDPRAELERMTRHHVDLTLSRRRLAAVYRRETRALPVKLRELIESRRQAYLDRWVSVLERCWPQHGSERLAITAHAALGIVDSLVLWPAGGTFDVPAASGRFTEMVLAGFDVLDEDQLAAV